MEKSRYVLGGSTWINLINTNERLTDDVLADSTRTFQWLVANNLLRDTDIQNPKTPELLHGLSADLTELRSLCITVLSETEKQGKLSKKTASQIQNILGQLTVRLILSYSGEKLNLIYQGETLRDHVFYEIIHSITGTLSAVSFNRIRKCEAENCTLHFIDTSKSGKRRWCNMETCGNRQKAADFYERNKARSGNQG